MAARHGPPPDDRVCMYVRTSRPRGTPGGPLCCGSWDEAGGGVSGWCWWCWLGRYYLPISCQREKDHVVGVLLKRGNRSSWVGDGFAMREGLGCMGVSVEQARG